MPYETQCPSCDGRGCDDCDGRGAIRLTGCPRTAIPRAAWETIDAAEMLEKGLPPEHGGMLDQAADFIRAARFVWAEQARCRAQEMRQK